jgi:hypothetical protein
MRDSIDPHHATEMDILQQFALTETKCFSGWAIEKNSQQQLEQKEKKKKSLPQSES